MDKIAFLSHCTTDYNFIGEILFDGYLRSSKELGIKSAYILENNNKVYSRLHFKDGFFPNPFGNFCFLLHKDILVERKNYFISSSALYGRKIKGHSFVKPDNKKDFEDMLNLIYDNDFVSNEVIFSSKISLRKYLIGMVFQYDRITKCGSIFDFKKLYILGTEDFITHMENRGIKMSQHKLDDIYYVSRIFNLLENMKIPVYFVQPNTYIHLSDT